MFAGKNRTERTNRIAYLPCDALASHDGALVLRQYPVDGDLNRGTKWLSHDSMNPNFIERLAQTYGSHAVARQIPWRANWH